MWCSRDSHGRMVPSASTSTLARVPGIPPRASRDGGSGACVSKSAALVPSERRRGQRGLAGGPVGEAAGQLHGSPVHEDQPCWPRPGGGPPARGPRWRPSSGRLPRACGRPASPDRRARRPGRRSGWRSRSRRRACRTGRGRAGRRPPPGGRRRPGGAATPSHSRALEASPCTSRTGDAGAVEGHR